MFDEPLHTDEEIVRFINDVKSFDKLNAIGNLFTKKYCYGFSLMLLQAFKDGEIFWDNEFKHSIFKYNNKFYDINGDAAYHSGDITKVLVTINETEFRY